MYNIIPLVLILVSLAIIIFIVSRKFSILANIDLESIPAEKEAQVKEMIIGKRIKRNFTRWSSKIMNILNFFIKKLSSFFQLIFNKLHDLREHYNAETEQKNDAGKDRVSELLKEFKELRAKENNEQAEKKLIDIIGLDSKNLEAWDALGELYYEQKNYEEAKQTFEHLIKLIEEDGDGDTGEAFFNLALVNRDNNNYEEALGSIKRSLEKHPNNPRYLDTMIEISIINKDKISALEAFDKLKEANPDNKKLEEWKKEIRKL